MNRLKELRKGRKLTQKELSEEIGVPLRTLQNWENEERGIKQDKAQTLADYFDVSVGYLLGYEYDEESFFKDLSHELFSHYLSEEEKQTLHNDPVQEAYFLSLAWDRLMMENNIDKNHISKKREKEKIKSIEDINTLDGLISDTLLANKLLDSLNSKMLESGIIDSNNYNFEIETVMSWLIDFNDALFEQKMKLSSKNN